MNQENRPEERSTIWGKHIQDWQKTTLSQSAYCLGQNLNYHRFTYWRRKLAGQAVRKRKAVKPSAFIPVQSSTPSTIPDISLTLSNGITVQGITSSNIPAVKQLLCLLS